ncbi:MAG: hypothetical protein MJZ64_00830, partial [Paludibacteraceae bacterium]|nr:hypothetical protein [Paludibacteraceae bacterium]
MKKILSFVMALAMVTSLVATPKVALPNKPMRKARTELAQPVVKKQQPQVKHVAKKHVARKAAIKKMAMATTVTFEPADFVDQGAESPGAPVSATKNGVTVSTDQGLGHRAYNPDTKKSDGAPDQFRVFIGGTLTIEATSTMTKIEFTFEDDKDGNLETFYTPNSTTWTAKELTKQARISSIVVTLDEDVPPTPPTPGGDVEITGLQYADAVFYEDETFGDYWAFDFYKELDEEGYILAPYVYFICNESTTSGTKIAGTWTTYEAGYFATDDEESGIYTDEAVPVGSLIVTCVSEGVYNFVGSFVGTDGKTYTWTLNNMDVYAYNGDTYAEITLDEGGEPTPPTPVGDYITPEQALEIGKALADNTTTDVEYRVVGIVSYANDYNTQYGSQTFSMSSDGADSKSNFKAYQCYLDAPGVVVGDSVAVTGKILKYVSGGNTTIEIKQGTVEILGGDVPPTPGEPIYTVINHPMVMDSVADFGWIYVSGENEEYRFAIQVNTNHLLGEFTNDDIEYEYTQMIDWVAYNSVDIESIPSVVIAQIADTLRFTATVKATSGQVYIITMNDYVAQPTGEKTYVDIMLPEVYNETETEGWFQVRGYDVTGEYYASLCVNTANMFGSFTSANMDWEYTGLYLGETTIQFVENSISVTVSTVADTVVYHAEALDVDGMKWIITMKDFTPTPTEVINLVTVEAEGEYYAEDGDYYATGVTAGGDQIAFDIYMDKLASGTYTLDDLETYYSGITLADGTFVEFYSADITLTVSGDDVTIEAVIIGRDVTQYNVTMLIAGTPTPVGDEITVAQAEEIAGALAEGATTTETYTINGYVGTLYDEGDFWLVSEAGGRSDLKVYRPTVDRALTKG